MKSLVGYLLFIEAESEKIADIQQISSFPDGLMYCCVSV
jgi:hypothetical protein